MRLNKLDKIFEIAKVTNLKDASNYFTQIKEGNVPGLLLEYENILKRLPDEDFAIFLKKVKTRVYKDKLRYWEPLFAIFHELKAFDYFERLEYNPKFIPESNKLKTPELYDLDNDLLVEVKTIFRSDWDCFVVEKNTEAMKKGSFVDEAIVENASFDLPEKLKDKIIKTINSAEAQLIKFDTQNIYNKRFVFLLLELDSRCIPNESKIIGQIKTFIKSLKKKTKIIVQFL